ncbi:membrane dipeptidase, partial [Thermus scotoductus]|uniref:membrane dipeptidase n=1 Tax=Thermus scotoductus TaxID=37636 RepID=UPI001004571B
ALYEAWEAKGWVMILRHGRYLLAHLARPRDDRIPGLVLLLEGAHSLASPEELAPLRHRGLRMLSLTWATRNAYAGGNAEEAPLTDLGKALLREMEGLGIALDLPHLAEEAAFQALEVFPGPVCATHANARALMPPPRPPPDRPKKAP